MRKLAFALAAALPLVLAAPAYPANGITPTSTPSIQIAQADVTVKVRPRTRVKKSVIVRHGRRHGCKTVTVRTRHAGHLTVKKIRRCR